MIVYNDLLFYLVSICQFVPKTISINRNDLSIVSLQPLIGDFNNDEQTDIGLLVLDNTDS